MTKAKNSPAQSVRDQAGELCDSGWTLDRSGNAISRTFKFRSFVDAFGWMTKCALHAEKLNHHPEWRNVYNRVEVRLTTHSAGTLTKLDIQLARAMDRFAGHSSK
ncbi:MAG: 4a-hydroxytetrahydrobiopterin dehydratase [Rhodobacteraceae bacterium]|nr:4a-hydroxytetrahydrobiopterin dehydratase [Paracoccaceae bacterium]